MWKNFQKVLENRVKRKNGFKLKTLRPDKYLIIKITTKIIEENYGSEGIKNIKAEIKEVNRVLILRCRNPIWRSELRLKKDYLIKEINREIKSDWINEVKFW